MTFLGLDLGSSFIKGAVLALDPMGLHHIERLPFPAAVRGLSPGIREFDPTEVIEVTRTVLERLHQHAPEAEGILICSQLHSLVFSTPDGKAVSRIINWQDQRALQPFPGSSGTYFDEIERHLTAEERRATGNEARPGVPLCFLYWLAQHRQLPHPETIACALPNFIVSHLTGATPKSDVTNAFAHGALDVRTLDWHRGVCARLGLEAVRWPEIVSQGTVLGEWHVGGKRLPIFAPVGDYHCSQVGSFLEADELSVNISTGSAVIQLSNGCEFGDFQTRPWFDGRYLRTITHIPGGRALQALLRLLSELALVQGVELQDPWDYILREAQAVGTTSLRLDPAFYFSAMGQCGSITNVREETLTAGHLFRAAFQGMADNYARCAERITPEKNWRQVVFSGGLALKTPLIRELVCERMGVGTRFRLAASEEDTLLGLLTLALAFSGRAKSVSEAICQARISFSSAASRGTC